MTSIKWVRQRTYSHYSMRWICLFYICFLISSISILVVILTIVPTVNDSCICTISTTLTLIYMTKCNNKQFYTSFDSHFSLKFLKKTSRISSSISYLYLTQYFQRYFCHAWSLPLWGWAFTLTLHLSTNPFYVLVLLL